jgi:hypothetical protein
MIRRVTIFLALMLMMIVVLMSWIASAGPSAIVQAECDCRNFEVLQTELRNAIHLQQAFRNKISDLSKLGNDESQTALKQFAEGDARHGLEPIPGYKGPSEFDYVAHGDNLAPVLPSDTQEELCALEPSSRALLNQAKNAAACSGIGEALEAHENVHREYCMRLGWRAHLNMSGAARAQEEVDAYGAQIAALRAEIGRVLDRSNFRVKLDVNTRLEMPRNPLYSAIVLTNKAEVPVKLAPASSPMGIRFTGDSEQVMDGTIEGNCRFNKGLPTKLPVHVIVDSDGLEAEIKYSVSGTAGSMGMECKLPQGAGSGMSMPVPMNSASNYPSMKLKLRKDEQVKSDLATGQAAEIMSRGGAKLSGLGTVTLIWDCSGK